MPDVTVPDKSIHDRTMNDEHPAATTPQGTQENGVDHGHEHRDVSFRPLFGWIAGLAFLVFLTIVGMRGLFGIMASIMTERYAPPSPLFATQVDPPMPRLLPNPVDTRAHPDKPFPVPGDYLIQDRSNEDATLKSLGLEDGSGRPALPPTAVAAVIAQGQPSAASAGGAATGTSAAAPGGAGLKQMMPSEASGGTNMENWLP